METELLKKLVAERGKEEERLILSVGGGLPLRKENRELLKKLGRVVYLRVSADTVLKSVIRFTWKVHISLWKLTELIFHTS